MEEKFKLKFIQLSDLHINSYRNLLEPMIASVNQEHVDFVVVTGDLVDEPTKDNFEMAVKNLNSIAHRVFVIPGDYDCGDLWVQYFGDRYKSTVIGDYYIELLDTSAMGHVFGAGWSTWLQENDKVQYKWLSDILADSKHYHLLFSHHPFFGQLRTAQTTNEYLHGNVRAVYSGHFHETDTVHFTYHKPRSTFAYGFCTVPLQFHGNSVYLLANIKANDEIIHIPKTMGIKRTAW